MKFLFCFIIHSYLPRNWAILDCYHKEDIVHYLMSPGTFKVTDVKFTQFYELR